MSVLSTWSPEGGILGVVAPLALAAAAGTALVIDFDPNGPAYSKKVSLAQLVAEGPRREHLSPTRRGVAVVANGGVGRAESMEVVGALCEGWPHVVLRLPSGGNRPTGSGLVPVRHLLPGSLFAIDSRPSVYQRCGWRVRPVGPGPIVPRPRSATIQALLEGRRPVADRWMFVWRDVWEAAWT